MLWVPESRAAHVGHIHPSSIRSDGNLDRLDCQSGVPPSVPGFPSQPSRTWPAASHASRARPSIRTNEYYLHRARHSAPPSAYAHEKKNPTLPVSQCPKRSDACVPSSSSDESPTSDLARTPKNLQERHCGAGTLTAIAEPRARGLRVGLLRRACHESPLNTYLSRITQI